MREAGVESVPKAKGEAGYELIDEFYDAAVSGADPIDMRPGFAALLERRAYELAYASQRETKFDRALRRARKHAPDAWRRPGR
jgi:hypothetical protein